MGTTEVRALDGTSNAVEVGPDAGARLDGGAQAAADRGDTEDVQGTGDGGDVHPDVAALTDLLAGARRGVAFTGAGVSTDSGIPDFRSPTGIWARYDPADFTFANYVADRRQRMRSWQMRREFWAADPRPNVAHEAIAELERRGNLRGVVTQNIDGLHQAAGSRTVAEIHGNSRRVLCIGRAPAHGRPEGCGFVTDTFWAFAEIDAGRDDPACPQCGGLVKSATISFGQALDPPTLQLATDMTASADVVLAVGTSLQVYPAAMLPAEAVVGGAALAIVNNEPTPLDDLAAVIVRSGAATLAEVVRRLPAGSRPTPTSRDDEAGSGHEVLR